MKRRVGRNDPCPCGSGKKYKKCCRGRKPADEGREALPVSGEFRFKPGSYGAPGSGFFPAAACLQWVDADHWHYHFVQINGRTRQKNREEAEALAVADLETAVGEAERIEEDEAPALLATFGYRSVKHFEVAEEDGTDEGFRVAAGWVAGTEDLQYNPQAQRALLEVVENQIRDQDPPETRETFNRLCAAGYGEYDAKKMISAVIAVQIYDMLKQQKPYDRDWYLAALRRLPTLPEELSE